MILSLWTPEGWHLQACVRLLLTFSSNSPSCWKQLVEITKWIANKWPFSVQSVETQRLISSRVKEQTVVKITAVCGCIQWILGLAHKYVCFISSMGTKMPEIKRINEFTLINRVRFHTKYQMNEVIAIMCYWCCFLDSEEISSELCELCHMPAFLPFISLSVVTDPASPTCLVVTSAFPSVQRHLIPTPTCSLVPYSFISLVIHTVSAQFY